LTVTDPTLLLYYRNRLAGLGLADDALDTGSRPRSAP
jgi:hypothetical protein